MTSYPLFISHSIFLHYWCQFDGVLKNCNKSINYYCYLLAHDISISFLSLTISISLSFPLSPSFSPVVCQFWRGPVVAAGTLLLLLSDDSISIIVTVTATCNYHCRCNRNRYCRCFLLSQLHSFCVIPYHIHTYVTFIEIAISIDARSFNRSDQQQKHQCILRHVFTPPTLSLSLSNYALLVLSFIPRCLVSASLSFHCVPTSSTAHAHSWHSATSRRSCTADAYCDCDCACNFHCLVVSAIFCPYPAYHFQILHSWGNNNNNKTETPIPTDVVA